MGEKVDNDSHSREGRKEDLDWKLILVILPMLKPLSPSSVSLRSLNGSLV